VWLLLQLLYKKSINFLPNYNEAMNVEDNVAPQNWDWEYHLSTLHEECEAVQVQLTDSEADLFDFSNEILMRSM
jgi:hypothetical protein